MCGVSTHRTDYRRNAPGNRSRSPECRQNFAVWPIAQLERLAKIMRAINESACASLLLTHRLLHCEPAN